MNILRSLLPGIVDYAGLFPPASLPLEQVVKNYESYRRHGCGWMLGRLILPAAKLSAFEDCCRTAELDTREWQISCLIPPIDPDEAAFHKSIETIVAFNANGQTGRVDTLEGKVQSQTQLERTIEKLPESVQTFLEIDWQNPGELIEAMGRLSSASVFAKIRTGSVVADEIPPAPQVAEFIHQCAASRIPLKATAGLHHPIRADQPLTYEQSPPRSVMHGFINVFLAAGFAWLRKWDRDRIHDLLIEENPQSFQVETDRIRYRDESLDAAEVHEVRQAFARSFGSCSFEEPVADLQSLGWLAVTANTI